MAVVAAGTPVSDLYAYVVADAGETKKTAAEPYGTETAPAPETAPTEDPLEGEGDYVCHECRMRFETEKEHAEHVRAEHPAKWEATKTEHERRSEEYDNSLAAEKHDTDEDNKTVRVILTAGFIGAVALILFVSVFDSGPEPCTFSN